MASGGHCSPTAARTCSFRSNDIDAAKLVTDRLGHFTVRTHSSGIGQGFDAVVQHQTQRGAGEAARYLLDPSEILRMPAVNVLVFMNRVVSDPIRARRVRYFDQDCLAGRWDRWRDRRGDHPTTHHQTVNLMPERRLSCRSPLEFRLGGNQVEEIRTCGVAALRCCSVAMASDIVFYEAVGCCASAHLTFWRAPAGVDSTRYGVTIPGHLGTAIDALRIVADLHRHLRSIGIAVSCECGNSRQVIGAWREAWAVAANQALKRYGHADRIDYRSFQALKAKALQPMYKCAVLCSCCSWHQLAWSSCHAREQASRRPPVRRAHSSLNGETPVLRAGRPADCFTVPRHYGRKCWWGLSAPRGYLNPG